MDVPRPGLLSPTASKFPARRFPFLGSGRWKGPLETGRSAGLVISVVFGPCPAAGRSCYAYNPPHPPPAVPGDGKTLIMFLKKNAFLSLQRTPARGHSQVQLPGVGASPLHNCMKDAESKIRSVSIVMTRHRASLFQEAWPRANSWASMVWRNPRHSSDMDVI